MSAGCTSTYLPEEVVSAIDEQWIPRLLSRGGALRAGSSAENVVDVQHADLLFEFVGVDGKPVLHRCSAREFLSSPWYTPPIRGPWDAAKEELEGDRQLLCNLVFPMRDRRNMPKVGTLGLVSRYLVSTIASVNV